jgi:hypothetical protein
VHLVEPRSPLQGTSGEFSIVAVVMCCFRDSQSWVSHLHICLHYELDREENFTSLQHDDRDDQFNSLGVSLNVLENFLKKPCTESEEATVSGLISKGVASVLKLWRIPWFSFLFLELTSEEPYCLALFQWDIAWQPEAEEQVSMRLDVLEMQCLGYMFLVRLAVTTYRRAKPRERPDVSAPVVTKFQQLNLLYYYQASKLCSVPVLELQGSTCNLFPPGTCQAHKVQSYTKFSFSDRNGEGIYFKVGHLFYHVAHHTTQGAYRCSGVTVYSHFHMCIGMSNGERLANNLCGSDVSIIQSLQDVDQFWVVVNLDGEANQHRKSQWDCGSCMIALCSSGKRRTTMHYHAHLQWSPLHLADTFLNWWVAWTLDGLEFSMDHRQAPFEGGKNVIRVAFSDHVQVSPNYCIDIIYYRGDYRHDPSRTKKIHVPWDPGKSSLRYPRKLRLGDKLSFKEGGMLGPLPPRTSLGRVPWACNNGIGPTHSQYRVVIYKYPRRGNERGIRKDEKWHGSGLPLPP